MTRPEVMAPSVTVTMPALRNVAGKLLACQDEVYAALRDLGLPVTSVHVQHDDDAILKAEVVKKAFRGAEFLYTLKLDDDAGRVAGTVPREGLWRAQTPQMFRRGQLSSALEQALDAGQTPSDEATAIERLGLRPLLVEGSPLNIKITHPADLEFASRVLAMRGDPGR